MIEVRITKSAVLFFYRMLDTTRLQCECFWYETIIGYLESSGRRDIIGTIQCAAPHSLVGFNSFRSVSAIQDRKNEFICSESLRVFDSERLGLACRDNGSHMHNT